MLDPVAPDEDEPPTVVDRDVIDDGEARPAALMAAHAAPQQAAQHDQQQPEQENDRERTGDDRDR
ncbi:hypothetical protein ACUN0C_09470 [Faunimonas sp. B44]|uniref:hypothetical protein n=1 Tax=Faunimonas sp. B44 TaxID=3461493 RepID=UPI0040446A63